MKSGITVAPPRFEMDVVDRFLIARRGTVLAGTVVEGEPHLGDELEYDGMRYRCEGIETHGGRKGPGANVGILIGVVNPLAVHTPGRLRRVPPPKVDKAEQYADLLRRARLRSWMVGNDPGDW